MRDADLLRKTCWIRKQELNHELMAHLYFSEQQGKVIIAPCFANDAGIYYEQETPIVLPFTCPPAELGFQADAALVALDVKDKNLKDVKLTDWPAYKASKAKSVKQFQAEYVLINLHTFNANLFADARPRGSERIDVRAYVPGAPVTKRQAGEWGNLLMQVYRCCEQLSLTIFNSSV
jgi:hypothetical protein